MTHENKHHRKNSQKHRQSWRRRIHRDWRVWVVVGLMLAAMFAYVMSDDESLQPGGGPPQQPVPAAGP